MQSFPKMLISPKNRNRSLKLGMAVFFENINKIKAHTNEHKISIELQRILFQQNVLAVFGGSSG